MESRPSGRLRAAAPLLLAAWLAAGCALLDESTSRAPDPSALQDRRVREAERRLEALESIDLVVRLDNVFLAGVVRSGMLRRAGDLTAVTLVDVELQPGDQVLALAARAEGPGPDGATVSLRLAGDVVLQYGSVGLFWLPRFHQASLPDLDPEVLHSAESARYQRWQAGLLERVNTELGEALAASGAHRLPIRPVPLGTLEAGVSLDGLPGARVLQRQALDGVFITQGSAVLIEPAATTVALDLNFVPSFSACAAAVRVSRSGFVQAVENREPVGFSRLLDQEDRVQHFYTEIQGAQQPATIVHYWFADGRPVSVVQLDVQPSARWRTWSSRPPDVSGAVSWEVLVIDQASGCILENQAVVTGPDANPPDGISRAEARRAYGQYRRAFAQRTAGFSDSGRGSGIARIEIRRPFFTAVLGAALRDLQLTARVTLEDAEPMPLAAELGVFDPEAVRCEGRSCESERECLVDYGACPLERDTRDCATCLFRNPLNNRCVNEGVDPICEAARTARNQRYANAHQACEADQQAAFESCERLREQEIRNCELETAEALSTCEVRREQLRKLRLQDTLATVEGATRPTGELRLSFSEFAFEGDLERIRMTLGLRARLGFAGSLHFAPVPGLGGLGGCLDAWQGDFEARVNLTDWESSLVSGVTESTDRLAADWSGFSNRVAMNPSPLQSLFVRHPGLLADCRIGLAVSQVARALTGADSRYLRGDYDLAIQPLPTRLHLLPAWIGEGESHRAGEPRLGEHSLVFEIGE